MGPSVNQSSLALKGGIGIRAMADIAKLAGKDGSIYKKAAKLYLDAWERLASAGKTHQHLVQSYGDAESWMLAYNLFAEQ